MRLSVFLAVTCGFLMASTKSQATLTMLLEMNGGAVVIAGGDPDGIAAGTITFDAFLGVITWTFDYTNLDGQAISALVIHGPGATPATSTPAHQSLPLSTTVLPDGTLSGFKGNIAAKVNAVLADPTGFYINIHTSDPGGFPQGGVRANFFQPIIADGNGNGTVGPEDYTLWADGFGQSGIGRLGDYNDDGATGPADYTLWADNFGQMVVAPTPLAVPEPSTAALLAFGLVTVLAYATRANRGA